MNKKKKYVASGLLLSALIVSYGTSALALGNQYSKDSSDCMPERHEAMQNAFENNDYASWLTLMNNKGRIVNVITEENFSKFSEAHQLIKDGRIEEAKAIRDELGLGQKNGANQKNGRGQMNNQSANRQQNRTNQQINLNRIVNN